MWLVQPPGAHDWLVHRGIDHGLCSDFFGSLRSFKVKLVVIVAVGYICAECLNGAWRIYWDIAVL